MNGPSARSPRVTVLTAVRNGEAYVDAAVASIVGQSFTDFEYIVVDDASTDGTAAILSAWANRDARIQLIHNAHSLNAAGALNRGLVEARGDYVAILDGDDIAYPTRLAEQVAFLDANPALVVVSAQVVTIDAAGKECTTLAFPTHPILARWSLHFQTPVLHSAALMRRTLLQEVGAYSTAMWTATDYELFARLLKVGQISNLPTTLVAYRHSPTQLSALNAKAQLGQVVLFQHALLVERLGVRAGLSPITALYHAVRGAKLDDEESLIAAGMLLQQIYHAFIRVNLLTDTEFQEEFQRVAEDCAARCWLLAWTHRTIWRAASKELLAAALRIDPHLRTRPAIRLKMRQLRARQRDQSR